MTDPRILFAPEATTAGDPVPVSTAPGVEGDPEPAAAPGPDWTKPIPLEDFPEPMREGMKGKTLKDLAGDHVKSRQIASKLGERNKALEAELAELKGKEPEKPELTDEEKAEIAADHQAAQMVNQQDFKDVLSDYFETGDVSEEFLDTIEKDGYRPTRSEAMEFLEFIKQKRQVKIDNINAAAEGQVSGEELWEWMLSEDCPLSRDLLAGFNGQADEGEYGWVTLAVKKYGEWQEGGGKPTHGGKGRFKGPTRRGRAPQAKAGEGEISKEDFASQLMEVRRKQERGVITKADAIRLERELTDRRKRTLGEK